MVTEIFFSPKKQYGFLITPGKYHTFPLFSENIHTKVIANHEFEKGLGPEPRVKPATTAAKPQFQLSNFRKEKLSIF